jgi:sulfatase modifying factor 1
MFRHRKVAVLPGVAFVLAFNSLSAFAQSDPFSPTRPQREGRNLNNSDISDAQELARKARDSHARASGLKSAISNSIGMPLVLIPPRRFLMGADDKELEQIRVWEKNAGVKINNEQPQHIADIPKAFYLGAHEVTQEEYEKVTSRNPSHFSAKKPRQPDQPQPLVGERTDDVSNQNTDAFPVETVTWYDAVDFCNKLSTREHLREYYEISSIERNTDGSIEKATIAVLGGNGYRLPTETEWEYACRALTDTPFHFGSTPSGLDGRGPLAPRDNFSYSLMMHAGTAGAGDAEGGMMDTRLYPTPVGSHASNGFGLYDMHGNISEWCWDSFDPHSGPKAIGRSRRTLRRGDPSLHDRPNSESLRVQRGGSWRSPAWQCRSAYRVGAPPSYRGFDVGFRVAQNSLDGR